MAHEAPTAAEKRRSQCAARRMPWMRRFLPVPDAEINQPDRQQGACVYNGVLATTIPDVEGVEWTIPDSRAHWTIDESRVHHTIDTSRTHWTISE